MSAVMNEMPKELKVELGPRKALRRRLIVTRDTHGHYWAGVRPATDPKYSRAEFISIAWHESAHIHCNSHLVLGDAMFPVSETEVEKLVSTFGLEVRL